MADVARFDAIGTRWTIHTPAPMPATVRAAVQRRLEDYDRTWSRFRDDAVIAPLRDRGGAVQLPPESAELADLYSLFHEVTRGAMTPLVGASLERLGYGRDRVEVTSDAPAPAPPWSRVRWQGTTLQAAEPVVLDVGAAGKGQLIDLVSDLLTGHGLADHVIDASGDIRHRGTGAEGRATRVGLEDPRRVGTAIGVIEIDGEALCASAGNRRRWGAHHHILDGRTGATSDRVLGTWVIADRAMVADALATALWFVPAVVLADHLEFEYARMHADGRVEADGRFVDGVRFVREAS